MSGFFDPTPEAMAALRNLAAEIPDLQQTLTRNNSQLTMPDRAAHQQQLVGSAVTLTIAGQLPPELQGLGVFGTEDGDRKHVGIGRLSTGLGCPHIETHPDFLGIMLAFRTMQGQRIDFIGINDPSAPTNSVAEFIALLHATAEAAGTDNVLWQNILVGTSLSSHLGLEGAEIAFHVLRQTERTLRSSSAIQQYWTGVVRARNVLGKFTFVPAADPSQSNTAASDRQRFSHDWIERQTAGDIEFRLYWIPFLNEADTPLEKLTHGWKETHKAEVGTVIFPRTDFGTRQAKLIALLASEMGANPGNWISQSGNHSPEISATEFTAGRFLVYRKSQDGRGALKDEQYETFFAEGSIDEELAAELIHRYEYKRNAGHAVPDLGEI